jgi:monoterpene epsilon-lactone hydrolase
MTEVVAIEACPVEALRNDHRRAMRLMGLLVERIDRLRRLERDDLRLTHDIFRYMVNFVDQQHHAREDRVIARLIERQPELESYVELISEAHDELRLEGETLLAELVEMRERRSVHGAIIVPRLANYASVLAAHFDVEDRELFARAATLLTPEDWAEIEASGNDPLFGPEVEADYRNLFDAYVGRVREIGSPSRVPAPRAAAVLVDSAAALIGGARGAASAIVSGSGRTVRANLVGASAVAQSRSLLDLAAAASIWRSGAVTEARAAVRRLRDVTRETANSTFDPVGSAFTGTQRQFVGSQRIDRTPPSWQAHLVNLGLRALFKRGFANVSLENLRQPRPSMNRLMSSLDSDVQVEQFDVGGGMAEVIEIMGVRPERTILHIPGGGFIMPAMQAHRLMAARFARQARARVVLMHYRLAPENPYPAGLDDCVAAYRQLVEGGTDPTRIVVLGDSAGGCLALALLLRCRQEGLPAPGAAVVISPVTDLSYGGTSRAENRWLDPTLPNDDQNSMATLYLDGTPADDPLVSPLYGDLSKLPPLLMQVGSIETLLDDTLRFAAKVRATGGECECEVWHEMPHDWLLIGMLPEAKKAMAHAVKFIERHTPCPAWLQSASMAPRKKVARRPVPFNTPAVMGAQAA